MTSQQDCQAKPSTSGSAEIAVVSVSSRIPEFWTDQPRLWFVQCEAVLTPQKMSDAARFDMVVTKLGKEVVQQVSDILLKPPEVKKYDTLKERLLKVYEESEIRQFQKLLSEMELGDQKPSQLLRRMRELARERIPDETLRIMWQGHLPSSVRSVLAVSEVPDLDNLAAIADKVLETSRPSQVAEMQATPVMSGTSDSALILAEIAKLSLRVRDLESERKFMHNGNNRFRSRSRSKSRGRYSTTRRSADNPDWLCVYHFKYHHRARKCVEPCAWPKTGKKEN